MKFGLPKVFYRFFLINVLVIFFALFLSSLILKIPILENFQILAIIIFALATSIILTLLFSTYGELLSNLTSTLRRMSRLENFSHPLLLKLAYEAPGTFHHSINVSILAQKAAKAIGADSYLVRVGAYYHDIGKLADPIIYVENQSGEEIPKDENAESIRNNAKKIIAHVKEGVRIAEEHHLPEEIINLILEHHGTTRALYFFEKAKERGLKIRKTDFRYNGPEPQNKEAAVLMLADSCEAAARAIPDLTFDKIMEIVDNTIAEKNKEKQFAKTNLSETDLVMIAESLTKTLRSIYHQRIIKTE